MNEWKGSREGRFFAVVMWLVPIGAVALGIRHWLPSMVSEHGAGVDRMLHYLLITTGGLLVISHIVFGYFLWRFSASPKPTFRLASKSSERKWSLMPIIAMSLIAEGGVLVLGLPVWAKLYGAPPANTAVIEVTAEQFAWNVRYPGADGKFGRTSSQRITLSNPLGMEREDSVGRDDIVLTSEIVVPVNKAVQIRLHAKDVLHSFFLPNHRIKQDVVPGMTIDVWFVPTEKGIFELACAELCGLGHYQMRGIVRVVSEEEYRQFLSEQPPFL